MDNGRREKNEKPSGFWKGMSDSKQKEVKYFMAASLNT